MRIRSLCYLGLLSVLTLLASCIKKEAPNMGADIVGANIDNAAELSTAPVIGNQTVVFRLAESNGDYHFAPTFELTPGATIEPESGTVRDFAEPQIYTVTSQDGKWTKDYKVSFILEEGLTKFSFENVEIDTSGNYDVFYEILPNAQKAYDWVSGNEGYKLVIALNGEAQIPENYPTFQTPNGYMGKGVKMVTRNTGDYGDQLGAPMAAGNLYIGTFNLSFPAINSTRFGMPYIQNRAPKYLKFYYKYKRGDSFQVNTVPTSLTQDRWNGYAIIFDKQDRGNYLPGTHNFADPRMTLLAELPGSQRTKTNEWTEVKIPFEEVNGKHFDPTKQYFYTIVFSSSEEGDLFNGAVGSTLWIDEVELVYEDE